LNSAELLLLGVAALGSIWALAGYLKATRERREARQRERLGARNAQREERANAAADAGDRCVICAGAVNPEIDIFDDKTRSWWHRDCWREALR
jgi:hypothetical protein